MKKLSLLFLFITLLLPKAFCTYSASFLKIDTGARAAGMGGVFCGICDDANVLHYNIGGLANLPYKEILLTHNQWFDGVTANYLGLIYPCGDDSVLGLSINRLSVTGLVEKDINDGAEGRSFGADSSEYLIGIGKRYNNNISAGIGIKIIQESIYDKSDIAYAVDCGVFQQWDKFSVGTTFQNLGTRMKLYEESFVLPYTLKLGFGYKFVEDGVAGLDIENCFDRRVDVKLGGEYLLQKMLAMRIGYKFNQDKGTGAGVSFGFGIRYEDYQLEYAYMPFGDLGNTNRISFNIKFGRSKLYIPTLKNWIKTDNKNRYDTYLNKTTPSKKTVPKKPKSKNTIKSQFHF